MEGYLEVLLMNHCVLKNMEQGEDGKRSGSVSERICAFIQLLNVQRTVSVHRISDRKCRPAAVIYSSSAGCSGMNHQVALTNS